MLGVALVGRVRSVHLCILGSMFIYRADGLCCYGVCITTVYRFERWLLVGVPSASTESGG